MSPKQTRIVIGVLGVLAIAAKQLLAKHFDLSAFLEAPGFDDLLKDAGLLAIGSQIAKRAGDFSAAHVDGVVEAKVAEKLRASLPPTGGQ